MNYKKISIDFHGVLNVAPQYFKKFMDAALADGTLVYVVSGGPRADIEHFLRYHEMSYTTLWCIIDEPEINAQTHFFADGSFRVDDNLWDKAKAEFCRDEKIGLHIDDSLVYGKFFTTGYCIYNHNKKIFYVEDKIFSAQLAPQNLLKKLMPFYKEN